MGEIFCRFFGGVMGVGGFGFSRFLFFVVESLGYIIFCFIYGLR